MTRINWFSRGFLLAFIPFLLFFAYQAQGQWPVFSLSPGVEVLFVGDMLFDRQIRIIAERRGEDFIFSCIRELIRSADFAVGNLEGPITPHPSKSAGSAAGEPNNFVFTFPPSTAALLAAYNFGAVNLGNNHIGNMGLGGMDETKKYLNQARVEYFGGRAGDEPVVEMEANGVPLSFVSYNEFGGASGEEVAARIKTEKEKGRVVVVYTHWGEEYVDSSARLRPTAKLFAESGADLVVGSHPHVVLGSEKIGETHIYYSLGNFIFDQWWDESVRTGLALRVEFSKHGVKSVIEHSVKMTPDGRTCPKK